MSASSWKDQGAVAFVCATNDTLLAVSPRLLECTVMVMCPLSMLRCSSSAQLPTLHCSPSVHCCSPSLHCFASTVQCFWNNRSRLRRGQISRFMAHFLPCKRDAGGWKHGPWEELETLRWECDPIVGVRMGETLQKPLEFKPLPGFAECAAPSAGQQHMLAVHSFTVLMCSLSCASAGSTQLSATSYAFSNRVIRCAATHHICAPMPFAQLGEGRRLTAVNTSIHTHGCTHHLLACSAAARHQQLVASRRQLGSSLSRLLLAHTVPPVAKTDRKRSSWRRHSHAHLSLTAGLVSHTVR